MPPLSAFDTLDAPSSFPQRQSQMHPFNVGGKMLGWEVADSQQQVLVKWAAGLRQMKMHPSAFSPFSDESGCLENLEMPRDVAVADLEGIHDLADTQVLPGLHHETDNLEAGDIPQRFCLLDKLFHRQPPYSHIQSCAYDSHENSPVKEKDEAVPYRVVRSGPSIAGKKIFDKIRYYDSHQYKDFHDNKRADQEGCKPMELTNVNYWISLINIGLTRVLVLKVLSKGPNHGYGILKELEAITSGCCVPTFGTIYPILKELSQNGYAEIHESKQLKGSRKRRVYTLTPLGVAAYQAALEAWRSTIPYIYKAIEDDLLFIEDLRARLSMK